MKERENEWVFKCKFLTLSCDYFINKMSFRPTLFSQNYP